MQHSGDIHFDASDSDVWLVDAWYQSYDIQLLHAWYQSLLKLPILKWHSVWCNAYMTCCCFLDASIIDAINTLVTLSLMPVLYDLFHAYWWAMMNASTYLLIIQNAGRMFYGGFYISYQNCFAAFCTWIDPNILSPFFGILNWFSFL